MNDFQTLADRLKERNAVRLAEAKAAFETAWQRVPPQPIKALAELDREDAVPVVQDDPPKMERPTASGGRRSHGPLKCRQASASDFGRLLSGFRVGKRLSQSRLAEATGFDHSYISRLEAGVRLPSLDAAEQLATVLRLSDDDKGMLIAAAGFLPHNPTSLVDPLAAQVHAALVAIKGTAMEATLRAAIGLMVQAVKAPN